mmetsp:Transcript_23207/g.74690  ORF Transcript_23207/g.74690 Transcript_23207/m.74690 type:complete len:356 (-) Transcript_23207:756-1823(-)
MATLTWPVSTSRVGARRSRTCPWNSCSSIRWMVARPNGAAARSRRPGSRCPRWPRRSRRAVCVTAAPIWTRSRPMPWPRRAPTPKRRRTRRQQAARTHSRPPRRSRLGSSWAPPSSSSCPSQARAQCRTRWSSTQSRRWAKWSSLCCVPCRPPTRTRPCRGCQWGRGSWRQAARSPRSASPPSARRRSASLDAARPASRITTRSATSRAWCRSSAPSRTARTCCGCCGGCTETWAMQQRGRAETWGCHRRWRTCCRRHLTWRIRMTASRSGRPTPKSPSGCGSSSTCRGTAAGISTTSPRPSFARCFSLARGVPAAPARARWRSQSSRGWSPRAARLQGGTRGQALGSGDPLTRR